MTDSRLALLFQPIARSPAVIRAALWMIASCAAFACLTVIIRHLGNTGLHPFEIVFFRNLFGLAALAPWFWRAGLGGLRSGNPRLQVLRGLSGLVGLVSWFTAVNMIPIAEVVALSFTAPLFATVAAIFVLGERVGLRRWSAVAIGFGGAMLILRPGLEVVNHGSLLSLLSACTMAANVVMLKLLTRSDSAPTIVAWNQLVILPFSFLLALYYWRMPAPQDWLWLVLMGAVATLGHLTLTRAFRLADATVVMPFDFIRLIFVALLGYVFFAEQPSPWLWLGASVIFVSAVYVAHREARLARPPVARAPARAGTAEP